MYRIAKEELDALFRKIAADQDLYVPVEEAGQVNFSVWQEEKAVRLEQLKTVKSPKDLFFPQSEDLYTCTNLQKKLVIEPEEPPQQNFVVFGMKPCDVRGLELLDQVFLKEPEDSFYAARRAHGTIVAMACREPEETCFCSVFGIDCSAPFADVAVWMTETELYWKPMTDRGEELTSLVAELMTEDEDGEDIVRTEQEKIHEIVKVLPCADLSLEGWSEENLAQRFDSPLWEKLSSPCLACGTCTFLCPTCQCYDIKDYDTGHGVKRYRCWDSCMYSDFTMMAHGNNRTTQMQRFRQRFMHKLVYFPANHEGMYSCVGCGRCVEKCPTSLHMIKILRAFANQEGGRHE